MAEADLSATRGESEYKMDTYVCKVRINDVESMTVSVKAMIKLQARINCRDYLRKLGYKIALKDIHVMDIDNTRPAMLNAIYGTVTKPSTAFCNGLHRISGSIVNQLNFWCTYCRWRHNPKTYYLAHERVNVELSEYAAYNPYC